MRVYYAVMRDTRTNLYYIEKIESENIAIACDYLRSRGNTIYKIVSQKKLIEWKNGTLKDYVDKYHYIPWGVWQAIEGYKI